MFNLFVDYCSLVGCFKITCKDSDSFQKSVVVFHYRKR